MDSNILDVKSRIWNETKANTENIRQSGIDEFIRIFKSRKDRSDQFFKWGDEVEYMIVKFDHQNKKVRKDEYKMMTIDETIIGNNDFIGLIKLIRQYLIEEKIENEINLKIDNYLNLISDRSTGKCLTNAKWIRNQIQKHPHYKFNSIITDQMNYDLLCEIKKIPDLNSIDQFYK